MTTEGSTLRELLVSHQTALRAELDCGPVLLAQLAAKGLLTQTQFKEVKALKERSAKVDAVLRMLIESVRSKDPDTGAVFVQSLDKSGQQGLVRQLQAGGSTTGHDLQNLEKYHNELEDYLLEVEAYIQQESRRAGVRLPDSPDEEEEEEAKPPDGSSDTVAFLQRVRTTTRSSLSQLAAFRCVLDKLREDCRTVARSNANLLRKLRECGSAVQPFSAKEEKPPAEDPGKSDTLAPPSEKRGQKVGSRSRQDEADVILDSVKHGVGHVSDRVQVLERDHAQSAQLLTWIEKQLSKQLQQNGKPFFLTQIDSSVSEEDSEDQTSSKSDALHSKVEKLVDCMRDLGHLKDDPRSLIPIRKSQDSPPLAGAALKSPTDIEASWRELFRMVRRGDRATDVVSRLEQLNRATRVERDFCLRQTNHLQKVVNERRLHLAASSRGPKALRRPQPPVPAQRRNLETSLSKKLSELTQEINTYMELERVHIQTLKQEAANARQNYEEQLERRDRQIKELQQRLAETPRDSADGGTARDQGNEKEGAILMKPVLLKRQDKTGGEPTPRPAPATSRPAPTHATPRPAPPSTRAPLPMPHSSRPKDNLLLAV